MCADFRETLYNGNNYKMQIRILHFFLNRNINIIMDNCYERFMGHLIKNKSGEKRKNVMTVIKRNKI